MQKKEIIKNKSIRQKSPCGCCISMWPAFFLHESEAVQTRGCDIQRTLETALVDCTTWHFWNKKCRKNHDQPAHKE